MKCKKCGNNLEENAKFCTKCGSPVEEIKTEKKKFNYMPIAIIAIVSIMLVRGAVILINEINQPKIVIPNWFNLESNESGVETYVDSGNPNLRIEIKSTGNGAGFNNTAENSVAILNTYADGQAKTISIYHPRERYYMNSGIPYVDAQYNSYVSMIPSTFETQSERIFNNMIKDGHLDNDIKDVKYYY